MAMKVICGCLVALALLVCLADAQFQKTKTPIQTQTQAQAQAPAVKPKPIRMTPLTKQHQTVRPVPQTGKVLKQVQGGQLPRDMGKLQTRDVVQTGKQVQTQDPKRPTYPGMTKQTKLPADTFQSCEVEDRQKIKCGLPDISALECDAIGCCFDGRTCYYGKFVTLQCTKDAQMIVVVARDATLPHIDLESLSFYGPGANCNPVAVSSAFAIYQFQVTECGTVMMEEPGAIIYENRLTSSVEISMGHWGSITRDSHFEAGLQCKYIGTSVEALVIEVKPDLPPLPVAAPGPLSVELRLGNGLCTTKGCNEVDVAYTSYYLEADYPITKVLREPVYVEVRMLHRTDPNIVLTLGRCWATADPYPHSLPQWDLLIDGCPYQEDRYLTALVPVEASQAVLFPTHYRRFVFKMFTFVGSGAGAGGGADQSKQVTMDQKIKSDPQKGGHDASGLVPLHNKITIHCNAAVCVPSMGNTCEPRCFRKKRDLSEIDQTSEVPETVVVSSPEITFINPGSA